MLRVRACVSTISGQTAGPIMTKFGMHMWIDLGMVPSTNLGMLRNHWTDRD